MQRNSESLVVTVTITIAARTIASGPVRKHVEGSLVVGDGDPATFVGWLELMALLEEEVVGSQREDDLSPQEVPT
jgi:hypothetical protein